MSQQLIQYLTIYLACSFVLIGVSFLGGKHSALYMARLMFFRLPWELVRVVGLVIRSVFGLVFSGFRR